MLYLTGNLMISMSGMTIHQDLWCIPPLKLLMVLYLSQGLEWILMVLAVLVIVVSIRIISTGIKFRKELKENKKGIIKGLSIVSEINSRISAEFAKRRIQYDQETLCGSNKEMQLVWEKMIREELLLLEEYDYNK